MSFTKFCAKIPPTPRRMKASARWILHAQTIARRNTIFKPLCGCRRTIKLPANAWIFATNYRSWIPRYAALIPKNALGAVSNSWS